MIKLKSYSMVHFREQLGMRRIPATGPLAAANSFRRILVIFLHLGFANMINIRFKPSILKMLVTVFVGLSLFLVSLPIFSSPLREALQEIETKTEDGVVLKGVRLVHEGAPKILFIHGFSENTYIAKEQMVEAYNNGFDVFAFNFRGHGNGSQKSLRRRLDPYARNSRPGFYGFDNIVTMDIPAMLKYVYSGTPITVVGHSLGGVSPRLFLSGVRQKEGKIYLTRSEAEITKYTDMVQVLIANASPTTFNLDFAKFNLAGAIPEWMSVHLANLGLSLTIQQENPIKEEPGFIGKIIKASNDRVYDTLHRFFLSKVLYGGLINVDNLSLFDNEAGRKFLRGLSKVPRDLIIDSRRWGKESVKGKGFASRNGVIFEGLPIPEQLAFHMVGGDLDLLAPTSDMIKDLVERGVHPAALLIILKGFAHIDAIAGTSSAALLGKVYESLTEDPSGRKLWNGRHRFSGLEIVNPKDRNYQPRKLISSMMGCEKVFAIP